jgi:hypothetical protein
MKIYTSNIKKYQNSSPSMKQGLKLFKLLIIQILIYFLVINSNQLIFKSRKNNNHIKNLQLAIKLIF